MPRMRILSASEQAAFDSPPLFNHEQRKQYFAFPNVLLDTAKTLRTPTSQVGFLLLCGYFKATKRFFPPQDFWQRDIEAVARELDLEGTAFNPKEYTETTRLRQQKAILEFYGFQVFDSRSEALLGVEISAMARLHLQPRLIFDRCIDFLLQKRIQVPKAGTLAELIRLGLNQRKTKWVKLMEAHLTDQARRLLEGLFTQPDNQNQYRLTLLKKLSQSTRPSRVREAIADFKTLAGIYRPLEGILATLALGHAGIRYFAGSVMKSEIFQIQRREANDRYIHAAAFVAHQFFRLQDNLTDLFLNVMASFQTAAIREHKDRLFEQRKVQNQQLKTVIGELDASVFGLLREIRHLTDDGALSDTQKVEQIRLLLTQGKTESFEQLKEGLKQAEQAQDGHDILEQQSLRLQSRLSPILKALDFEPITPANPLAEAIRHFKSQDGAITDKTPTGFLDEEERAALVREDGTFRPSLYKVFLFRHVAEAIKSGSLNLSQSYKYRPLDSYLIDQKRWQQDKQALLEQAGLTEFMDPEPVLKALEAALFRQYQDTNAAIGGNPHLHFRVDGSFYVHTPALDTRETDPLQELFPRQHDVPLAQVLDTINRHCGMLGAFAHWQQVHISPVVSRPALLAGIMGLGCGIGVRKMARISARLTEYELEHVVNWRFSLENIRAANDQVLKAMDAMELPTRYRREAGSLHTASDGQKFEVRGESLHASRSFKYFGQGQGVSAYTFVDERHFLWHSLVISAADRESAYVIDGLMRNEVVKSDIHSTDTHGYTETIFGLIHLLGFSFAPRIKDIGKQTLYSETKQN